MLKIVIKISFIFLLNLSVSGQMSNVKFQSLNNEDGLSNNTVFAIIQDNDGFMWFGTAEGLNKFDGYNFTVFKPDLFDTTTISDSWITSLHQDSHEYIWVGTFGGGVNKYDKSTNQFLQFKHVPGQKSTICDNVVYSIAETPQGNIWIGTDKGISIINQDDHVIGHLKNDVKNNHSLSYNAINQIYVDLDKNIWVCTEKGLNLYKPNEKQFERFMKSNATHSISSNNVWHIVQDPENKKIYWVATFNGINQLNYETKQFKHYKDQTNKDQSNAQNRVQTILADKYNVWAGTRDNGLKLLNKKTGKQLSFIHKPHDSKTISTNRIESLYKDKSGLIWIGGHGGGVNKLLKSQFIHLKHDLNNPKTINDNLVWSLIEDGNTLWVGTDNGLAKVNLKTSIAERFFANPGSNNSLSSNKIYSLHQSSKNILWIGTSDGGLNKYNTATGQIKVYKHNPKNANSLPSNYVKDIAQDSSGMLWLATRGGGISKFNPDSETFTNFQHDPNDPTSLPSNRTNAIYVDFNGFIWVGNSGGGASRLNPQTGKFTNYLFDIDNKKGINDRFVLSICQSRKGYMWFGTYNGGMNKFDPGTGEFKHYSEKEGLTNNIVYGIIEDNQGILWISTNNGISRFDVDSESFVNYDVTDGLQGLEYNTGAAHKGKSGRIYFGGTNGLNHFMPSAIKRDSYSAPVVFTELKINNKTIVPEKHSLLSKPICKTNRIDLDYKQRNIQISYSALDYVSSRQNYYSYKLKSYDAEWSPASRINFVKYTNLPPGEYTFMVRSISREKVASTEFTSLQINISPPFWKMIWFRLLVVFLIIGTIALTGFIRINRIKKQKQYLEKVVENRTKEIKETNKKLKENYDKVQVQQKNLSQQKKQLERQNQRIISQNLELEKHRNNLEELVYERTKELKTAKEKAEESDRLKTSFLANMSHEIRTPINSIVGFSQLLEDETDPVIINQHLELITSNTSALLSLIDNILNLSRLESGSVELNNTILHTTALLEDVYENNVVLFEQKNISLIKKERGDEATTVKTDYNYVSVIFNQLLQNALKYTENGQVIIGAKHDKKKKQVLCYVKDTGIGMSQEAIDLVFKRFTKLENADRKLYRGTGIGLALCKRVVELLRGEIWIESEENKGTSVFFTLPAEK